MKKSVCWLVYSLTFAHCSSQEEAQFVAYFMRITLNLRVQQRCQIISGHSRSIPSFIIVIFGQYQQRTEELTRFTSDYRFRKLCMPMNVNLLNYYYHAYCSIISTNFRRLNNSETDSKKGRQFLKGLDAVTRLPITNSFY